AGQTGADRQSWLKGATRSSTSITSWEPIAEPIWIFWWVPVAQAYLANRIEQILCLGLDPAIVAVPQPMTSEEVREAAAGVHKCSDDRAHPAVRDSPLYPCDHVLVDKVFAYNPGQAYCGRDNQVNVSHRMWRLIAWLEPDISNRGFAKGSQL